MLMATDARNANVQGKFLKPSTNRSEVVNPHLEETAHDQP